MKELKSVKGRGVVGRRGEKEEAVVGGCVAGCWRGSAREVEDGGAWCGMLEVEREDSGGGRRRRGGRGVGVGEDEVAGGEALSVWRPIGVV